MKDPLSVNKWAVHILLECILVLCLKLACEFMRTSQDYIIFSVLSFSVQ